MKGIQLDRLGDCVITNGSIQMIKDNELIRQTIESVIGTNNGEWFLNEDEGINFKAILTKSPNMDEVRSEIQKGLLEVQSGLFIRDFSYSVENRTLFINFTASNGTVTVEGGQSYVR